MEKVFLGGQPFIKVTEETGCSLLISQYDLGPAPYHQAKERMTGTIVWETCSLKRWLSTEWIQSFSHDEQSRILEVSIPDMAWMSKWFPQKENRVCFPSDAALRNGAVSFEANSGACVYWLQDAGRWYGRSATVVRADGGFYPSAYLHADNVCIRPILRVRRN